MSHNITLSLILFYSYDFDNANCLPYNLQNSDKEACLQTPRMDMKVMIVV